MNFLCSYPSSATTVWAPIISAETRTTLSSHGATLTLKCATPTSVMSAALVCIQGAVWFYKLKWPTQALALFIILTSIFVSSHRQMLWQCRQLCWYDWGKCRILRLILWCLLTLPQDLWILWTRCHRSRCLFIKLIYKALDDMIATCMFGNIALKNTSWHLSVFSLQWTAQLPLRFLTLVSLRQSNQAILQESLWNTNVTRLLLLRQDFAKPMVHGVEMTECVEVCYGINSILLNNTLVFFAVVIWP